MTQLKAAFVLIVAECNVNAVANLVKIPPPKF